MYLLTCVIGHAAHDKQAGNEKIMQHSAVQGSTVLRRAPQHSTHSTADKPLSMSIEPHKGLVWWCRVTEAEELSRLIEGARYQLKLLPNKSLSLWLTFTARKEAAYNFDLPISLLGYGFSVAGCSPAHPHQCDC